MAKVVRISGQLKIQLSYNDRTDQYKARLCPVVRGERCETIYVGAPKHKTKAVDSAAAYSSAAHAAISFASDHIQDYAAPTKTGSGWAIRKPRRANPRRRRG
jgi:hypothetical protein